MFFLRPIDKEAILKLFGNKNMTKEEQEAIITLVVLAWFFWPEIKALAKWTSKTFMKLMKIQLFIGPEYKALDKIK